MDPTKLTQGLEAIKGSDDFAYDSEAVAADARRAGVTAELVRAVFEFMEANAALDYGVPGALVHLVEELADAPYEAELLASIARRPTSHTLWMLNRVINGTRTAKRTKLIAAMRVAGTHPHADDEAKKNAAKFLKELD